MMFELVKSDEVLDVLKSKGPMQPLEIKAVIKKGDSIIIGACLSELSARGLLLVTKVKRGGSPYYYIKGQEAQLERLAQFLNEKDIRAYNLLKEKKVLRESKLDPLTRVSCGSIPDFSKQLKIKVNGLEEIFWRYFLISEREAIDIIRAMFKPLDTSKEKLKIEEKVQEELNAKNDEQAKNLSEKKEITKKITEPEIPKPESLKNQAQNVEKQQHLDQTFVASGDFFEDIKDDFLKRIKRFFTDKNIVVKDSKLLRKGSDYEFIIEMQTAVGAAEYFCKAKGKKKCNDGDLSSAYLAGQMKRLPVVFITTGEVAKKAKEKLLTDYKGMLLKEI